MIKLTEVHKKYNEGTVNEVYALDDINLEVSEGEFITIIGTNGSGKTTLFNIIAGTEFPDCGRIFLNGKDVTNKADYKRAKNVARVFQNPFTGTAPEMSISENLLIAYFRIAGVRAPTMTKEATAKAKYCQINICIDQLSNLRICSGDSFKKCFYFRFFIAAVSAECSNACELSCFCPTSNSLWIHTKKSSNF